MHTANIIAVMYRTFINLEKLLLPSSFYFRIFIEYKNFYIIHKHMIMRFFLCNLRVVLRGVYLRLLAEIFA